MNDALRLTQKQQKLFEKLEKTYKELEKSGVGFYNLYGTLHGYQKKYVSSVNDEISNLPVGSDIYFPNSFKIENEWADDAHYIHLTELGEKKYNKSED